MWVLWHQETSPQRGGALGSVVQVPSADWLLANERTPRGVVDTQLLYSPLQKLMRALA